MGRIYLMQLFVLLLFLSVGCQEENITQNSNLTPGMAKTKIINGVTTQNNILKLFGSPNIITKNKSGNEVWTYDQISLESSASSANIGGGGAGLGSGGIGGGIAGLSSSKSSVSTKTFTLMIEFNDDGTVKNSSYRSSKF